MLPPKDQRGAHRFHVVMSRYDKKLLDLLSAHRGMSRCDLVRRLIEKEAVAEGLTR